MPTLGQSLAVSRAKPRLYQLSIISTSRIQLCLLQQLLRSSFQSYWKRCSYMLPRRRDSLDCARINLLRGDEPVSRLLALQASPIGTGKADPDWTSLILCG